MATLGRSWSNFTSCISNPKFKTNNELKEPNDLEIEVRLEMAVKN